MTGRRKNSTTVYLTDFQVRDLHRLTARTGVPMAEFVRRAIDAFLGTKEATTQISAAAREEAAKAARSAS